MQQYRMGVRTVCIGPTHTISCFTCCAEFCGCILHVFVYLKWVGNVSTGSRRSQPNQVWIIPVAFKYVWWRLRVYACLWLILFGKPILQATEVTRQSSSANAHVIILISAPEKLPLPRKYVYRRVYRRCCARRRLSETHRQLARVAVIWLLSPSLVHSEGKPSSLSHRTNSTGPPMATEAVLKGADCLSAFRTLLITVPGPVSKCNLHIEWYNHAHRCLRRATWHIRGIAYISKVLDNVFWSWTHHCIFCSGWPSPASTVHWAINN